MAQYGLEPPGPGRLRTAVSDTQSPTAGASNIFTVPTNFDNVDKRLRAIIVLPATNRLIVNPQRAGFQIAAIDTSVFAAAAGVFPLEATFKAGVQFTYSYTNNSGATVSNVVIVFIFDVDDTVMSA